MFENLVNEQFYHIYSYSTTLASCVINTLLIYILAVTNVHHIGPYRWLLMSFSIVDICTSIIHALNIPVGHMTEYGTICVPLRFAKMPTIYGFWAMLAWIFLFYQTFILLAFHYVYRFVVLCDPPWLSWIRLNPYRNWISIAIVTDLFCAGSLVVIASAYLQPFDIFRRTFGPVMKDAYNIDLFADNMPGFLALTFWIPLENGQREWQWSAIFAMVVVCSLIALSVTVIVYCIVRIVREAQTYKEKVDSKTRRMQMVLFRALIWQTIIPTITYIIPASLMIVVPLITEIPMGGMATIGLMSGQLFPMIDPFLVLYFVPRQEFRNLIIYRAALLRIFLRGKFSTFVIATTQSRDTTQKTNGVTPNTLVL